MMKNISKTRKMMEVIITIDLSQLRLIKQVVDQCLKEWDEARLNKEFRPDIIYRAITCCCIILRENEWLTKNSNKINDINNKYFNAILNGDRQQILRYQLALKTEIIKDQVYISKFYDLFKNTFTEDDTKVNFYTKTSTGFLSSDWGVSVS